MAGSTCYLVNFAWKEAEYEAFVVKDEKGKAEELFCQKAGSGSMVGNIYIGKVERVLPQIGGAFVRIGSETCVFLPLEDAENCIYTHKFAKKAYLCGGDELLVEIVKDPIKTKDAVVSSNLSFPSKHLLLTTAKTQIGVSRKLPESMRREIKETLGKLECGFGFVVRTNAQRISAEELLREAENLVEKAETFLDAAVHREVYSLIRRAEHPFLKRVETFLEQSPEGKIQTDIPLLFEALRRKSVQGDSRIMLYQDDSYPLYKLMGLPTILERALNKKVYLSSGAYLVIEPTEALTVIDVNSGKRQGKGSCEDYYYQINLEAAEEIARQVRLRNISGMVLVDFINMNSKERCDEVLASLRHLTAADPCPVQVLDYTRLHLVEMTRKKEFAPLIQQLES